MCLVPVMLLYQILGCILYLTKHFGTQLKKKKKTERKSFYPEQRLKKISEEKIIKMKLNFDI